MRATDASLRSVRAGVTFITNSSCPVCAAARCLPRGARAYFATGADPWCWPHLLRWTRDQVCDPNEYWWGSQDAYGYAPLFLAGFAAWHCKCTVVHMQMLHWIRVHYLHFADFPCLFFFWLLVIRVLLEVSFGVPRLKGCYKQWHKFCFLRVFFIIFLR